MQTEQHKAVELSLVPSCESMITGLPAYRDHLAPEKPIVLP